MKVQGREVVGFPPDETWRRLLDPAVLKRCTPGLEQLDETAPGHFEAVLALKLPAIKGRFSGSVDYLEQAPPERLLLRLKGKGPPGFVDGTATLALEAVEGGTAVSYNADVQVGGQIARLGQRLLSGAVTEMAGQFFEAFQAQAVAKSAGAPAPATPSPLAAFLQLAWRTLLNWLGLSKRA